MVDISSSSSSSSSSKPTAKGGGETLSVFLFSDSMEVRGGEGGEGGEGPITNVWLSNFWRFLKSPLVCKKDSLIQKR